MKNKVIFDIYIDDTTLIDLEIKVFLKIISDFLSGLNRSDHIVEYTIDTECLKIIIRTTRIFTKVHVASIYSFLFGWLIAKLPLGTNIRIHVE